MWDLKTIVQDNDEMEADFANGGRGAPTCIPREPSERVKARKQADRLAALSNI